MAEKIPLGLTAVVSAEDAGIHENVRIRKPYNNYIKWGHGRPY